MLNTAALRRCVVSVVAVAVAGVVPALAGITYRVSAVTESTTLTLPDRSILPPDLQPTVDGARPQPRPPARWTKSAPISLTAKVTVEGANVRIDDYLFEAGRGKRGAGEFFLSSDAGSTFDIVDPVRQSRKRFPLEMSLNPAAITMKAFNDRLRTVPTHVRIGSISTRDGGLIEGFQTQRHRVRISFRVPADQRFRRSKMSVTTTLDVWTTNDVPERVAPALHAWSTGFQSVDDKLHKVVANVTGFPVKVVSEMELGLSDGQQTTVSKLEVTDVELKTVAASVFEVAQ